MFEGFLRSRFFSFPTLQEGPHTGDTTLYEAFHHVSSVLFFWLCVLLSLPPGIPCLPERSRMPQEAPKRPQHGLQTAEEDLQWLSKIPQGSENPRKRKEYRKLFYMMPSRSRWTS